LTYLSKPIIQIHNRGDLLIEAPFPNDSFLATEKILGLKTWMTFKNLALIPIVKNLGLKQEGDELFMKDFRKCWKYIESQWGINEV